MAYTPTTQGGTPAPTNPFETFAPQVLDPNTQPNASIVTGVNPVINQPGGYLVPTTSGTTHGTQASLTETLAQMPKDQLEALQQKLISTGLFPQVRVTGVADGPTLNAYNTVLGYSYLYQTANPGSKMNFTPDEILDTLVRTKPKDTTQSTTTVNLTNPVQARQSLITAFSDKLGRRPTDSEVAAFTQALNTYERSNPDTTTADVAGDGSGTVKSVTNADKGTGTLNFVNDFASNYATTNPATAQEYQAAQHLAWYQVAIQALTNGGVSTGLSD